MRTTFAVLVCILLLSFTGCGEIVTVVDFAGKSISADAPVRSIVSLAAGASEIICALDGGESLLGRSANSDYPPYMDTVATVGKSSFTPDIELILELGPDMVVADTMISDSDKKTLEDAGIPVMEEKFIDPLRTIVIMENLGRVMGKEERARELVGFIKSYRDLIQDRVATLPEEDLPEVFFEWYATPYRTVSSSGSYHNFITFAGGLNVAADLGNESNSYPDVSPEWVVDIDPDVILQSEPSTKSYTKDDLADLRERIMKRPELRSVKAKESGRVFVMSGKITSGIRAIVGELYLAKWLHPRLFEDVDPDAVHRELIEKFYGLDLEGAYALPESS
ncbi:MAG: Cobalamin-binding protein precursor [Methanosaeta sp. PtaB.Bin039]|nr:MAG: Cobalamin-binding protein precursor [Methanosaeta sp. PtaB.Bin039]HOT06362.1 ABC transporter substrate-binding protein [Methanotrichaceae archaeon]HQF16133.1 ABC transporter substrate-binding protein [Methanotrichaceae archaeon]HQI90869.1 ABC transporter substrate-binding protein [Methanotrichaceae archaeon]HQJ28291.1 ABC transporter substrate-binding protein [Methanotrichaceae archaeon]